MNVIIFWVVLFSIGRSILGESERNSPHIVMIIGDDMGSNDVSYRGSNQFTTPNIDALGYNGVILNRHYTQAICTPSRTALLTGKYPIRTGMQGTPIKAGEDRHLPYGIQTLPQLLKDLGYSTHMVGKWHLGAARRNDTPTEKGFDTHFGYWNGFVSYFDYQTPFFGSENKSDTGFDLKDNFTNAWSEQGKYATELFTEKALDLIENQDKNTPMFLIVNHLAVHTGKDNKVEAKDEKEMNNTFGYIEDLERRRYVDALSQMDQSVGKIVEKLQEQDMLKNSVVIFLSDNGAMLGSGFRNGGSNYPLRGGKLSLHEGGIRNAAALYSPLLKMKSYVYDGLLHITDWIPTLYSLAGGDIYSLKDMDGFDQWQSISENKSSNREEILANIDEVQGYSAIIGDAGRYKLVNGTTSSGLFDVYGPALKDNIDYNIPAILNSPVNKAIRQLDTSTKYLSPESIQNLRQISSKLIENNKCKNSKNRENVEICKGFCLFDLLEDPCETENLIEDETKQEIVSGLKARISEFWKQLIPQTNKPVDVNSDPAKYNGTWCTWLDDELCAKTPMK
ncbi:hypothetical protein HHI36_022479 [Cryptolaemus montrouzieri]|uniref:Sulfatase N-terminal domain-containing protein n=1 Tax=Cryptolaemus montrouzieri TaxID=559131 RepID=A0ABD2MZS5_9CUCU